MLVSYPQVGKCIYCGAKHYSDAKPHRRLGDEHIIPEGLGGKLLLREASCQSCEGVTSSFEGMCLRRWLGPMRIHLGFKSKRPSDRPTTLPIQAYFDSSDNNPQIIEVPISEHPIIVWQCHMVPPSLLGRPLAGDKFEFVGRHLPSKKTTDDRLEIIQNRLKSHHLRIVNTVLVGHDSLMLAKIAHAYAVAEIGLDNFYPFLCHNIRFIDFSNLSMYIGGSVGSNIDGEHAEHGISHRLVFKGRQAYVVIRIKLVPNVLDEIYDVVVGRLYNNKTLPSLPDRHPEIIISG